MNAIRMKSKKYTDMTSEQYEHIMKLNQQFADEATEKYEKGCIEHGGGMWNMTKEELLDEAIQEAIDQVIYLMTLRDKP